MKGKTGHKHRETGGRNDAAEDVRDAPERRNIAPKIFDEADRKKDGGRAKRKSGGMVHHEKMENMKHAKHVGKVHGEEGAHHAGRKPRKSGGRTGSDGSPYTAASKSTPAPGRNVQTEFEGSHEA